MNPATGTSTHIASTERTETLSDQNGVMSGAQGVRDVGRADQRTLTQRQSSRTPSQSSNETADSGQEADDYGSNLDVLNPASFSDTLSSDMTDLEPNDILGLLDNGGEASHFLDTKPMTFGVLSSSPGPKVLTELVGKYGRSPSTDVKTMIEKLLKAQNEKGRQQIVQVIQTELLPEMSRQRNLRSLAQCMTVKDIHVQKMAASLLQKHLLRLTYRDNRSLTSDLLEVAKTTQQAFLQSSETDSHVHVLTCLHLFSVSALMTRCPSPSPEECRTLDFSSAPSKKKDARPSGKRMMERALNIFYKDFNHNIMEQTSMIPVWKNVSWQETDRLHRRESFGCMTACEQIVLAFTLLNEVALSGRSDLSHKLLSTLSDLKDVVHKDKKSKSKDKDSLRFAIDLLLVRGLVFLLHSTFKEVMTPVGDTKHDIDHTKTIADLITSIIQNGDLCLKQETEELPFHSAPAVRETFSYLHFQEGHPQCLLAVSYIQKYLQKFGFQVNSTIKQIVVKQCQWYELECYIAQEEACLVALIPKHACLATGPILSDCLKNHLKDATSGMSVDKKQILRRAKYRLNNFDLLVMLNKANPHSKHILRLYAYQEIPFPFCITEAIHNRRLLQFLLSHRHNQQWLCRHTLLHIWKDITEALVFLNQKNIVQREITTYNMIVDEARPGRSFIDVLPSGRFIVKLADFGLAHRTTNAEYQYESSAKVAVEDQGPVPCRWLAPEALKRGVYCEQSMVYSLGCVGFELFTHGCQPFTSYDRIITTEQLLLKVLFDPESVTLHHWLCIPDDIFDLIMRCVNTTTSERPTLQIVATELQNPELERANTNYSMGLEEACDWKKKYPPISPDQRSRNHQPEMGVPTAVQECIRNESMAEMYINTKAKNRRSTKKSAVTNKELAATDWVQITTVRDEYSEEKETVVKEYVSETFINNVLPRLEACDLPGVTCWTSLTKTVDTRQNDSTGLMLHAILARIGRMRHLPSPQAHVSAVVFEDSLRWYPPEMMVGEDDDLGTCCTGSDVYMLGTTFWEVFNVRQVVAAYPGANETHFAPYASIPKDKVAQVSRSEKSLCQPAHCPDWLYELIISCRHPDHARRPSCRQILDRLYDHCTHSQPHRPFWPRPTSHFLLESASIPMDRRGEDTPPPLPERRPGFIKGFINRISRPFNVAVHRLSAAYFMPSVYGAFQGDGAESVVYMDELSTHPNDSEETYLKQLIPSSCDRLLRSQSQRSVPASSNYDLLINPNSSVHTNWHEAEMPAPDYDLNSVSVSTGQKVNPQLASLPDNVTMDKMGDGRRRVTPHKLPFSMAEYCSDHRQVNQMDRYRERDREGRPPQENRWQYEIPDAKPQQMRESRRVPLPREWISTDSENYRQPRDGQ